MGKKANEKKNGEEEGRRKDARKKRMTRIETAAKERGGEDDLKERRGRRGRTFRRVRREKNKTGHG